MASFDFDCPYCNGTIEADDSLCGQVAECPACGKEIVVPHNTTNLETSQRGERSDVSQCVFWGQTVNDADVFDVDMDNVRLSGDGQKRGCTTFMLPCCLPCRQKILSMGLNMFNLRKVPVINEALRDGASFSKKWLVNQKLRNTTNVFPSHDNRDSASGKVKDNESSLAMYCRAWTLMFDYGGRASRAEYWKFVGLNVLIVFLLTQLGRCLETGILREYYEWVILLPIIPLGLRRFRDAGLGVGDWLFLSLLNFTGAVAVGYTWKAPDCPNGAFVLATSAFFSSLLTSLFVCCLKSQGEDTPTDSRAQTPRPKVYTCFVILLVLFAIGAYFLFSAFERYKGEALRKSDEVQKDIQRMQQELMLRTKEPVAKPVVAKAPSPVRQDRGDFAASSIRGFASTAKNVSVRRKSGKHEGAVQRITNTVEISDEDSVSIFPDVRIPIPKGYRAIKSGSLEDAAVSALYSDYVPGCETKVRFVRENATDVIDQFNGSLKIDVSRRLSVKRWSPTEFRLLKDSAAAHYEKFKNNDSQTRRRMQAELDRQSKGVKVEIPNVEVATLSNLSSGLFSNLISDLSDDTNDKAEKAWHLATQGLVLINGHILFVIQSKLYDNHDSAVRDAAAQEKFIQNWCDEIGRCNSSNRANSRK